MPPVKRYQKEDIVNIAYEIVKNEWFNGLNARRIAKELNCSVQPIFHNFQSMEELEKNVYQKIYNKYQECLISATDKDKPYLAKGLAYINFASQYPEFFKILFMKKSDLSIEKFLDVDGEATNSAIKAGQTIFGLSYDEQKKLHIKTWIFAHGIACLLATKTVILTEDEIRKLTETTAREILRGFKENRGGYNE